MITTVENCKSLNDIISFLENTGSIGDEFKKYIRTFTNIENFVGVEHSYFGRYLRNVLSLWQSESHLYKFFNTQYGLAHADDMSGLILRKIFLMYNEHWVDQEISKYKEHWKRMGTITTATPIRLVPKPVLDKG